LQDSTDPFEALDSVNSRLKQLCLSTCQGGTLFEYLAQSNQSKHLEGLGISNTSIDSIDPIKNLTNLTLLSISSVGSDNDTPAVDLKRCLDVCPPSLKTLHIYSYKLEVARFNNRLDSIETLDIGHHKISSKLGDILSNCLPNLVKLRLAGEVVENVDIILKNPHFQEAVFSTEPVIGNPDGEYGFAFSFPDKKKYYHCTDNKKMRVKLEAIKDLPILDRKKAESKEWNQSLCMLVLFYIYIKQRSFIEMY
jgi:hypothetical protein